MHKYKCYVKSSGVSKSSNCDNPINYLLHDDNWGKEMGKISSASDGGGVRAWNSRQCTAIALKINISTAYRRWEL